MFWEEYSFEKDFQARESQALREVEASRLAGIARGDAEARGSSGFASNGLFNSVKAGVSRSVDAVQSWYTGSSKPQEECC